ncbi:MAG: efflux RND transporter periplasmic adaptor subunit [Gemmatimonadota bacterium]|nr:MAG: efflux RND transporter periplasmic adaptor subunit [Gemmatimonadota bacterium]
MNAIRQFGAAILTATIVYGCGGGAAEAPPPPQVTVATPERRDVQVFAEFTGTTQAVEFARIRARVPGTLEQMLFTPASFVDAGDVLFIIEPEPYRAAFDEAQAAFASAESELARAQSDLERIQQAIQSNAVSQQDLDRAQATRDQAEAAKLGAQARLDNARINLGYTRVTTPIAGQVSRNRVDLGNLVGAGEPTLLTTVTRIDPIYVYFDVPEQAVLQLAAAQDPTVTEERRAEAVRVLVATAIDTDYPHEGVIDFIDNTVNPATGTIELRAVVENPESALFPGLFVRIRVLGRTSNDALLVEERAIGTDLGGKYVLVVGDDDMVEQRYVTLSARQDDGTYVVEAGLEGDERYIVNGMLRARPGFPVTPQTETEIAAATSPTGSTKEGN